MGRAAKTFFDHVNTDALEQPVLGLFSPPGDTDGIAVQFIEELGARFAGVGDTVSDIFGGLYREFTAAVEGRSGLAGVAASSVRGGENILALAGNLLSFGVLLADTGYFAGMLVPREVRAYLENLTDENRAAAAVKLEAARAALAAAAGRAPYANPAFEG